ncbi:hypothetical protein BJ973_005682 [Actinoplanes tereljensis]|uniref:hypothetical protein n=1 Tax=Paractinoplanes tereljensis TaxID=571912 RepID=UPI00194102D5|nr:hypothetical protein [Actinoplanes tereljensis]
MAERDHSSPDVAAESAPAAGERTRAPASTVESQAGAAPGLNMPAVSNGALARALGAGPGAVLGAGEPGPPGLPPEALLALQGAAGNRAVTALLAAPREAGDSRAALAPPAPPSGLGDNRAAGGLLASPLGESDGRAAAALLAAPPGETAVARADAPAEAPTSADVGGLPPAAGIEQQGGAAMRTLAAAAASSGAGAAPEPAPVAATLQAAGLPGVSEMPPAVSEVPVAPAVSEMADSTALVLRDTAMAAADQSAAAVNGLASGGIGAVTFTGDSAEAGRASAMMSEFFASIGARAGALVATGTAIAAEYRATAAATAGQIRSAAAERAQAAAGHVAQLTVDAQGDAAGAVATVAARRDAAKGAVTAASDAARARLESGLATSLAAVDARLATHLAAIDTKYSAGDGKFRAVGKTVGDEAAATGAQMAEKYMEGLKDESDGFWDGPLTYNRGKARRDTAREISTAYRKGLVDAADKQAEQAQAGRLRDAEAAKAAAAQAREALRQQHAGTLATVDQAHAAALRRADDAYATLSAAILHGRAGGQQLLGELEAMLAANIRDAAEAQAAEVEHQAALLATATLGQVGRAVAGMLAMGNALASQLNGTPSPSADSLGTGLAAATAELDAGVADVQATIAQSKAAGDQLLAQSGPAVVAGLGASTQQGLDAATTGGTGVGGAMRGVAAAGEDAFGSIEQQHTSALGTMTTAADSGFGEVVAGLDRTYAEIDRGLDLGFTQSVAGLEQGLRGSLAKMPAEIRTKAEENADRVPPRWKKIAKVLLIVAVVLVVALVVGPFVIGAVGAALGTGAVVTGIIAGGIVGAATGATLQVINNWSENRPLGEGVLKAALIGGVGGAVGGGAGAFFAGGTTVVNTAFRQFLADTALNTITETVINVATTGEFSWAALGMAVLSAAAVGGALHGVPGFRGVQGRSMKLGESFGGAVRTRFGGTAGLGPVAGGSDPALTQQGDEAAAGTQASESAATPETTTATSETTTATATSETTTATSESVTTAPENAPVTSEGAVPAEGAAAETVAATSEAVPGVAGTTAAEPGIAPGTVPDRPAGDVMKRSESYLRKKGIDPHELKQGQVDGPVSHYDIYEDRDGNLWALRKKGRFGSDNDSATYLGKVGDHELVVTPRGDDDLGPTGHDESQPSPAEHEQSPPAEHESATPAPHAGPGRPLDADFDAAARADLDGRPNTDFIESWDLVGVDGPHKMSSNKDPSIGANQQRYYLTYKEDFTGMTRQVSVNFDPDSGQFGVIKFSSNDPSQGGGGGGRGRRGGRR